MAKEKICSIDELKYDEHNFNKHTDEGLKLLEKSVEQNKFGRSILVDKDNNIIAGNGIVETARKLGKTKIRVVETSGEELVVVKRNDLHIDSKEGRELALADNATAAANLQWNEEELAFAKENWGVEPDDWGVDVDWEDDKIRPLNLTKKTLADKFIVPPFSVLDTKQGYWQTRKDEWIAFGIKSEVGRDENITYAKSAQSPVIYNIRNAILDKTGKDPTWDELLEYCDKNNIAIKNGTSIFDPVLCEICYKWFNVDGGTILDPFAGGSVRGIVASKLGYKYYGNDLRKEQIDANIENAKDILMECDAMPTWTCGDSLDIDKTYPADEFDMVFSCPPYADLEVYSDNEKDLSNMEYDKFIGIYGDIIKKCCDRLKNNRFAVFVVGEVRGKKGNYYNFVADTIKCFTDAGLNYYNEIILLNSIGSAAIRAGKKFNSSRKVCKVHQNVLVFYKGNMKDIKKNFKELDLSE